MSEEVVSGKGGMCTMSSEEVRDRDMGMRKDGSNNG